MPGELPGFSRMIEVLARHDVEFIVVGGFAAIIEGVPITTSDLDVVYHHQDENLIRLARALEELNAHYRDPAGRYIVPNVPKLATIRLHLLQTDLGKLDVLTRVGDNLTYFDLVENTKQYEVSGFSIQVLNLETIIKTKEHANRPKDRAVLGRLREFLDLQQTRD